MAFGCIKVHQPVVRPSLQGVKIFYVQVKSHCSAKLFYKVAMQSSANNLTWHLAVINVVRKIININI